MFSKGFFVRVVKSRVCVVKNSMSNSTKQQILDSSKLQEFADDRFKFDEMAEISKRIENTLGKGEIAHY